MRSAPVLLTLAIGALFGTAACENVDGGGTPQTATRNFALSGKKLTVEASESEVRIEKGDGGQVEVERSLTGKAADGDNATWAMEGTTLKLAVKCTGINVNCSAKYSVRVPGDVSVVVNSSGSPVRVVGLTTELTATVSVDGSLRVENPTGVLRLTSHGSSIVVTGAKSTDVIAKASGDGNVNLTFVAAPSRVEARSRGGAVKVSLPDGPETYRLEVSGNNGGTTKNLTNDARSRRSVTAVSVDGTVQVQKG